MRKTQDDAVARTVAENQLGDLLAEDGYTTGGRDQAVSVANSMLAQFADAVEFETAVSKVRGGQEIPVRRLVITTAWEVNPNAVK